MPVTLRTFVALLAALALFAGEVAARSAMLLTLAFERDGLMLYADVIEHDTPATVADSVRRAEVHGSDISGDAVRQARANARALGISNASFHRGDLFAPLPRELRGRVDVITLHPPYVPSREVRHLPIEVRGFEPEHTLTDFSLDGLGLLERTTATAPDWLQPGGWLLVEVSPDRARTVRGLLARTGYRDVRSTRGWPDITRVVVGRA
jgi:release factor glutamine methyltransferase